MFSGGMDGMTYILKGYVRKGVENKMKNNSNKRVASPYLFMYFLIQISGLGEQRK